MGLVKRKNGLGGSQPQYAESTTSTKLFKSDQAKFEQLCQRQRKVPAEVLRQIVNEALTRQEMLSRDEQHGDGISRRLIEDSVAEQLKPVRQEVQDLKGCLREIASMIRDLPSTPVSAARVEPNVGVEEILVEVNRHLDVFSTHIHAHDKELTRLVKGMAVVQDRAERWGQAAYVLNGHIFSWVYMILDLLGRYVVVPQVGAMEPDADAALLLKDELEAGLQEARKKRKRFESKLDLPDDGRIKF
ncbi:MAG: hypothetical protein H7Z16_00285 [Pyrinomonadaceae bacterium]|nr:hypothetical protein [Pyrinomonadaceae bacterium]